MMGLGSMGSGVGGNTPPSSTSNLSALAPPFTVDRSNPKLNSSTILHYSDSSYGTAPDCQTWQYPHPSAPGAELNIDSTRIDSLPFAYPNLTPISSVPPSTDWFALSSNAKTSADIFSYTGEAKPYYSPNVSPIVDKDRPSLINYGPFYDSGPTSGPDLSSQVDYTESLSGLEYAPRWDDAWAFDDVKQPNQMEFDGSVSSKKLNFDDILLSKSYLGQGVRSAEYGNNAKQEIGVSYGKVNHVSGRESHIGSSTVGHVENKSFLEQNLSFVPYESSRMPTLISGSAYTESRPSELSIEGSRNFSDCTNLNSPYEKYLQPLESSFSGSISVTRSFPAVVIRPPSASVAQNATHKTVDAENNSGVYKAESSDSNGAKQIDPFSRPIESSFNTGQYRSRNKGNDRLYFAPPSAKELSSQVHCKETLDQKVKVRRGSPLPDVNLTNDFPLAVNSVSAVKSAENFSDCVDNYTPAVDSPCWKGAPVSHFSPFDNIEGTKTPRSKKKLEEYLDFNHEAQKIFLSLNDSVTASSQKPFEVNKFDEIRGAGNIVLLSSERSGNADCETVEQSSTDAIRAGFEFSSINCSKGVQMSNPLYKSKKEFVPNDSMSGYDQKISSAGHSSAEVNNIPYVKLDLKASGTNSVMNVNDASEGGAVAVHAAENVLCSPSSLEDAAEDAKVDTDPNLDVQTMINAIHALSESLLLNYTNNAFSLEEHSYDVLKHVISNLEACMTKKIVPTTLNKEPVISSRDISSKLVDASDMAALSGKQLSGKLQAANEALNSDVKLDSQQMHEEKRSNIVPGKKAESSSFLSPLRGDAELSSDDIMAQAIKKVLDENFLYDEEMDSQALLFKNLWLEAEAKLCSITYKARFNHMKIEMEKFKSNKEEANSAIVEKMLKFQISPNPSTDSNQPSVHQDGRVPEPAFQNASVPSTSSDANDAASVMERFHILKSRNNKIPVEKEELQEMVENEHAGTQNSALGHSGNIEASVMDRFRILKSRNDDISKPIINIEDEQPEMVNFEQTGKKNLGTCTEEQSENENLNVPVKPYYPQRTGSLSEGKFGSFVDASGYESVREFHLSVANDPVVHSFTNDKLNNQFSSGWYDNSSSDWEHVLKDDIAWKT